MSAPITRSAAIQKVGLPRIAHSFGAICPGRSRNGAFNPPPTAEICRALPVRSLRLEVEQANPRAETLYRAAGFVGHDRRTMTKRLR